MVNWFKKFKVLSLCSSLAVSILGLSISAMVASPKNNPLVNNVHCAYITLSCDVLLSICDALRDLVSFVQFKKSEKHPSNFTKNNTLLWVFFTFFKTYKWYQIAQRITYWQKDIFIIFFIFRQMIALQKRWKMFISSKKLSSFSRYSNFLYFRLPLFFPLSAIAWEVDPRKILKFMTSSTV